MIARAACEAALQSPNVGAFLRVIRQGESGQTEEAFRMLNGGGRITDLSRHPYDGQPTPPARASGAYQFLGTTWAQIKDQLGLYDFSPASQDLAAVGLIMGRGALQDVLDGNFDVAVAKCRKEWTSLPGASENRPGWTLDKARTLYQSYGGQFAAAAPIVPPAPIPERKPVMPAPLLLALAPLLADLIPQVAKLFSSGSEVATRNVAAVEAVANTVVAATNSQNVQQAIEKMQADPAVATAVQQAVVTDPIIMGLLEIGGGINKAREMDALATVAERPFWYSPAFIAFMVLMPLLYIVVVAVTFNIGKDWSDEMRSVVVTAIVTGLLGSLTGFYFGSSYGSQKKTDLARV